MNGRSSRIASRTDPRVGLVGAGAMGSALAACWRAGGANVVSTLAGRSPRTRALAVAAGIRDVPFDEVVAADLVVSVVPPAAAVDAARTIAAAAGRVGARPLVADLNAIAPATLDRVAAALGDLELVDGSISGPPPQLDRPTRLYLSGPRADELAELPGPGIDAVVLRGGAGAASALKMCTASMYKGTKALVMQAMLTARRHGVLAEFLADVELQWPDDVPGWPGDIALAATKADRFVGEMREIAATQAAAGLAPELFAGAAAAYARAATTPLGRLAPEEVDRGWSADDVLARLAPPARGRDAVLFDFSGTLFHIETPAQALLAALGPEFVPLAPRLTRLGAINGSTAPQELPDHLTDLWERRDLSADAHRAAYSGLSRHGGLTGEQAEVLYERGVRPEAWQPYPDTIATLRGLRAAGVPVALVSNIGWNPRPVLERYGVADCFDALVLSYEVGVMKPDPAIFRIACAALDADPGRSVMVGDSPEADGGSTAIGVRFEYVDAVRADSALQRAVLAQPD